MPFNGRIAERAAGIKASGIRKIFDLAASLESPVDFSIGQPHFDIPEPIKEAGIAAINEGFNRYTPSAGIAPLKEAIAGQSPELIGNERGLMITSGVSGGLTLSILALINPGDEVLIPDPGFVSYQHIVRMAGGVPVFWDTYPDFRLHPERIEAVITSQTKVIFVNSPSNPTGIVYTSDEIHELGELCNRHAIIPVSDETYCSFAYDHPAQTILSHCPDTVVLRGFSKDYAMTGWRMGYASAPETVIDAMTKLQQFTFVNAPSFAQRACLAAGSVDIQPYVDEYMRKRDLIVDTLKDSYRMVRPEGAFYCFPEVPHGNATDFVMQAIEKNILMVPGGAFSTRDTHFRISYAVKDDVLEQGLQILLELAVPGS